MSMALDSSELFRQENYGGKIRELRLTGAVINFSTLRESLDFIRDNGYIPREISIVNLVGGSPERNKPLNAVYCSKSFGESLEDINSIDALILQINKDGTSIYSVCKQFRFLQ